MLLSSRRSSEQKYAVATEMMRVYRNSLFLNLSKNEENKPDQTRVNKHSSRSECTNHSREVQVPPATQMNRKNVEMKGSAAGAVQTMEKRKDFLPGSVSPLPPHAGASDVYVHHLARHFQKQAADYRPPLVELIQNFCIETLESIASDGKDSNGRLL